MKAPFTRRSLLGAAVAGTAQLAWPYLARAATGPLTSTTVADGVTLLHGAGGNITAIDTATGVVLVDCGADVDAGPLNDWLTTKRADKPVSHVFNTHWHLDHTGCNDVFTARGVPVIAHENTRLWMTTDINSTWNNRVYPPRPTSFWPTDTFYYGVHELDVGADALRYGYLSQAHTDGDLYVHLPERNVIVAGGVVTDGSYPLPDYVTGGWLGGMIDSLNLLLEICDDNTIVIPAHGTPVDSKHLQAQRAMCEDVLTKISNSYYKGESYAEFLISLPTRDHDALWGEPRQFLHNAYEGVWGHITEVRRYLQRGSR